MKLYKIEIKTNNLLGISTNFSIKKDTDILAITSIDISKFETFIKEIKCKFHALLILDLESYLFIDKLAKAGYLKWVILSLINTDYPVHGDWVKQIKETCHKFRIPFYFTGWGKYVPINQWQYNESYNFEEIIEIGAFKQKVNNMTLDCGPIDEIVPNPNNYCTMLDGKYYHQIPKILKSL